MLFRIAIRAGLLLSPQGPGSPRSREVTLAAAQPSETPTNAPAMLSSRLLISGMRRKPKTILSRVRCPSILVLIRSDLSVYNSVYYYGFKSLSSSVCGINSELLNHNTNKKTHDANQARRCQAHGGGQRGLFPPESSWALAPPRTSSQAAAPQ